MFRYGHVLLQAHFTGVDTAYYRLSQSKSGQPEVLSEMLLEVGAKSVIGNSDLWYIKPETCTCEF
jgi:hypothetical protein